MLLTIFTFRKNRSGSAEDHHRRGIDSQRFVGEFQHRPEREERTRTETPEPSQKVSASCMRVYLWRIVRLLDF